MNYYIIIPPILVIIFFIIFNLYQYFKPINCKVSEFSQFVFNCENKNKTRERTILIKPNPGGFNKLFNKKINIQKLCPNLTETIELNNEELNEHCSKDCKLGNYKEWSECSEECGDGISTRTKEILEKEIYNGKKCQDFEDYQEQKKCVKYVCSKINTYKLDLSNKFFYLKQWSSDNFTKEYDLSGLDLNKFTLEFYMYNKGPYLKGNPTNLSFVNNIKILEIPGLLNLSILYNNNGFNSLNGRIKVNTSITKDSIGNHFGLFHNNINYINNNEEFAFDTFSNIDFTSIDLSSIFNNYVEGNLSSGQLSLLKGNVINLLNKILISEKQRSYDSITKITYIKDYGRHIIKFNDKEIQWTNNLVNSLHSMKNHKLIIGGENQLNGSITELRIIQ